MTSPSLLFAFPAGAPGLPAAPSTLGAGTPALAGMGGGAEKVEPIHLPPTAQLVGQLPLAGEAPELARQRLVELLEDFDPSGTLARDLDRTSQSLRDVAIATAESPHLHPIAPQLGDTPRVELPPLLDDPAAPEKVSKALPVDALVVEGEGTPEAVPPESLFVAEDAPVAHGLQARLAPDTPAVELVPVAEDHPVELPEPELAPSLPHAPVLPTEVVLAPTWTPPIQQVVPAVPLTPVQVSAERPAQPARTVASTPAPAPAAPQPSMEWTAHTITRSVAPRPAPVSARPAPAPTGGTFDAAPWLVADDLDASAPKPTTPASAEPEPSSPPTRPLQVSRSAPMMLSRAVASAEVLVDAGDADVVSAQNTDITRPAMSAVRSVRTAAPLSPALQATAPEVPVMPHERSLTRVDVRVSDGDRVLEVGVTRESEGYAVEVRAPRDFVAEIQDMEGDIDAALREDGGEGLASFDASAEDEYEARDSDLSESEAPVQADATPAADPRRILDRHA